MPFLIPRRKQVARSWLVVLAAATFLALGGARLSAQTDASREYQVKAVFLFNFAHFVDWPPPAFPDAHSPFVIGVLGDNPFGGYLDNTVRGETVGGRPLVVRYFKNVDAITNCQVLFIAHSEDKKKAAILEALKGKSILTVSDVKDFDEQGGVIRFVTTAQNKIHFRINLGVAKSAGLVISSKLLRVADLVEGS